MSAVLLAYLSWYVSPSENLESVKIVANTKDGCIGETMDGFSVNIGPCDAGAGDVVSALVDEKVKERTLLMNP